MRVNDQRDDGHGTRGGKYALDNRESLDLDDDQLNILYEACAGHTGGRNHQTIPLPAAGRLIDWI